MIVRHATSTGGLDQDVPLDLILSPLPVVDQPQGAGPAAGRREGGEGVAGGGDGIAPASRTARSWRPGPAAPSPTLNDTSLVAAVPSVAAAVVVALAFSQGSEREVADAFVAANSPVDELPAIALALESPTPPAPSRRWASIPESSGRAG